MEQNNIMPIIIIILVVIGILFFGNKMQIPQQSTQTLEPVRGQTILYDYENNIMPHPSISTCSCDCPSTALKYGSDYEDYFNAESGIVKGGGCREDPEVKIENGELFLQSRPTAPIKLYLYKNLRNADISIYYTLRAYAGSSSLSANIKTSYGGMDSLFSPPSYEQEKPGVIRIEHDPFDDPNVIHINIAGREIRAIVSDSPFYIESSGGGAVMIDEIRYSKPFTSCITDETETIYADKFAPNSVIRWVEPDTFDYEPLRFCYDVPAWKFIDGKFYGTDYERATLVKRLSQGEDYPLAYNEEVWIFPIVKYVEGMGEKCKTGEAKTKDGKCIKTRYEEPITIFQCNVKSDCPVPPSCDPETVVCSENNLCVYTGVECKAEVLVRQEIIKQIVEKQVLVEVYDNEFLFSSYKHGNSVKNEFLFGRKRISQNPDDSFNEQYLKRECTTTVLNDTYWDMQCIYTVDMSFLKISSVEGFKQILLDGNNEYKVGIKNYYVDFSSDYSGFTFDCYRIYGLQEDFRSTTINNGFDTGDNIYSINVYNDMKGEYICELIPKITIVADTAKSFSAKEKRLFTYLVTEEIIDFGKVEMLNATFLQPETSTETGIKTPQKDNTPLYVAGGILLFFIIIWKLFK